MRESSWDECVEDNIAVNISPDLMKMKSLIETANERLKFLPDMTHKNCNFVFEGYYTSVLEILQAIVVKRGYKILNHICVGYFLRDILRREDLYILFDTIRYRRNNLVYYGKKMDAEVCKESISLCKKIIKELNLILVGKNEIQQTSPRQDS